MALQSIKSFTLKAPSDGFVVAIKDVPDPVFAHETLGAAVAIEPLGGRIFSPVEGRVIQCADTKHALTIEIEEGVELLLHLGVDTVIMKGQGLDMLVCVGDKIKVGTPLICYDTDLIARHATSLVTPMVSVGKIKFDVKALANGCIKKGDDLAIFSRLEDTTSLKSTDRDKDQTVTGEAIVELENGMHARPASKLKAIAEHYQVKITLVTGTQEADASRLTELLGLGLMHKDHVNLIVTGIHAKEALEEAIVFLQTPEGNKVHSENIGISSKKTDIMNGLYAGIIASRGLAIGPLRKFAVTEPVIIENAVDVEAEKNSFLHALNSLQITLDKDVISTGNVTQSDILAAHRAILEDDDLILRTLDLVSKGKSVAFAWKSALDEYIETLIKSPNHLIRERTGDIRDLQIQLLNILSGKQSKTTDITPNAKDAIIVARDLTPSQMIALSAFKPAGLCLAEGGATSHVAILCRGAGIPCLMGLGEDILNLQDTDEIIVLDGEQGILETKPSKLRLTEIVKRIKEQQKTLEDAELNAHKQAKTRDERIIEVTANISSAAEAEMAFSYGADGVGLFRSEFLFLDRDTAPTIEEQYLEYQGAVNAMKGKPVVIRTLDIGADKQLSWLNISNCPNPALGIRGVRLVESNTELMVAQMRALLSVKAPILSNGKSALQIMLPMVTDLQDITTTKRLMLDLAKDMGLDKNNDYVLPQLGAMIEVPAAALLSEQIAEVVDFLSIGTNDLTQYTLAMDREETHLANRLDVMNPAVLRLISLCVEGAKVHDCPVAVCGAAAGDPLAGMVLAALGVCELSVEPRNIAQTKERIRVLDLKKLRDDVLELNPASQATEIRSLLEKQIQKQGIKLQ